MTQFCYLEVVSSSVIFLLLLTLLSERSFILPIINEPSLQPGSIFGLLPLGPFKS